MTRLPGAIFIVDILREKIAVKEAQKLNIPIFAMVDTNSDPRGIDYVIPANDDASKSISKILEHIGNAIQEGLEERNSGKDQEESNGDTHNAADKEASAEEASAEEASAEEASAEEAPSKKKATKTKTKKDKK